MAVRGLRWLATGLFIFAVPVFLVLTNVRIVATEPRVFEYSFDRYNGEERTGISRPQLDRAAQEIVDYFRNDAELLDIRVQVDGAEQPLFNQREILHMRDVKDLFQLGFRIHEVAFVYIVGYVAAVFLWSRERSIRRLARETAAGGFVTIGILGVAAVGVVVGFDSLFSQFHQLAFSNDFWKLDPRRDHLIQMFPNSFWFDVTLGVGVLTVLEGALLVLLGRGYLWRDGRRPAGPPDAAASPDAAARPDGIAEHG